MGNKWKRPDNIEFPTVWLEFQAQNIDSDDLVTYRVQDLPENRNDEAIDIMVQHFLKEEPLSNSLQLHKNPKSVKSYEDYLKHLLQQKMVIVCFREGSDEIVGLNFIGVSCSDDDKSDKSDQVQLDWIDATIKYIHSKFNVFEYYGVDKCISSAGLVVMPKYRNRGVAKQILRAREHIGKKMKIPITATIFTAKGSQKCSHAVGYTVHLKVSFEELSAIGIHYPVKNMADYIEYSGVRIY